MSNHVSSRALVVIVVAPLFAVLACASGGKSASPAPGGLLDPSMANSDGKSVEDMLATRFPGVTVDRVDGGGLQIRIRGGSNSFYGSNEPLYLVDDSPVEPDRGGILFLNPNDIETIEVLKNPADTGLYGVRGANGVIKITTKRPGRR